MAELQRFGFRGGVRDDISLSSLPMRRRGLEEDGATATVQFGLWGHVSSSAENLVSLIESSHCPEQSGFLWGIEGSLRLDEVPSSFQANLLEENSIVGIDLGQQLRRRRIMERGVGLRLESKAKALPVLLVLDVSSMLLSVGGIKAPSKEHVINVSPLSKVSRKMLITAGIGMMRGYSLCW